MKAELMRTLSPSGGGRERKVDGYSHLLEETIVKSNLKDDYLEKEEYRVLRFSDKDVLPPCPLQRGINILTKMTLNY